MGTSIYGHITPFLRHFHVFFDVASSLLNLSIDTTGTPHYNVGKFLAKLLNPLAQNEYTLRDSFHAVSEIKSIPKELFTKGYRLVSFDVVSLFTNVPLTKTVKIILDRAF